jgi:hypothetical protein
MSDTDASQPSTQTVPKERLDEVLGKARALEQQLQFTQAQVTHLLQGQQRQTPVAQDPEMQRIEEENPVLYKKLLKQEQDLKQMRAGFFGMADEQDRIKFVNEFGENGKKKLAEVEQVLEQERQRGNVQASRGSIYMFIRGQEKIREEMTPRSEPRTTATTTQAAQTDDAPSSNPNEAIVKGGTAAPDFSNLSREDRLKKLENVTF